MKILVTSSSGHNISIPIPTALVFSPTVVKFGLNIGRKYAGSAMPDLPPETVQALCQAIQQITRDYDHWELVHVESADGALVSIIL